MLVFNKKGFALPLALAVSMIILIIGSALFFSTRQRIETVREMRDRSLAFLKARSAYNRVIYYVSTSLFTPSGLSVSDDKHPDISWWNLFGDPIVFEEGVTLRLRDLSGMVSPLFQPAFMKRLVESASNDVNAGNIFRDTLADWQDADDLRRLNGAEIHDYRLDGHAYGPRNFYIQLPQELALLKDIDKAWLKKVESEVTYWGSGAVNYLTMSGDLLRAMLGDDSMVEQILDLRKRNELTQASFRRVTGMPWREEATFFPSGWIRVEVTAVVNRTIEKIEAVVVRQETDQRPFMVVEWKR